MAHGTRAPAGNDVARGITQRAGARLGLEAVCSFVEDDELHLTLSEHARGCRLELVNILSTPGAGARNAAGWEMCLDLLDQVVAGSPHGSASDAGMEEFLPVLEKYKALGVPDDGWLPDPPG